MPLSFGPWRDDSEDAKAFRYLFKRADIFKPQARDGDQREAVDGVSFPGAYLAVFDDFTDVYGYVLYTPRPSGVFEQHTGFIAEFRGATAEADVKQSTAKMFLETPCSQIVTFCPEWLPATKVMARRMGAQQLFTKAPFATRDGKVYAADLYGQTALQWAWRNHMDFAEVGAKWHDQVFAAIEPHHDEDRAHNAFLGLALEMGKKQPQKAAAIYAAWAELAGYEPGRILWANQRGFSLIDIGAAAILNGPEGVISVIPHEQSDRSQNHG